MENNDFAYLLRCSSPAGGQLFRTGLSEQFFSRRSFCVAQFVCELSGFPAMQFSGLFNPTESFRN